MSTRASSGIVAPEESAVNPQPLSACGRFPSIPSVWDGPIFTTHRLFLCALCRIQVRLCRSCDRGHRYCGEVCSAEGRRRSVRRAGRGFLKTLAGRLGNARRQRARRARMKRVTHQGSATLATEGEPLLAQPMDPLRILMAAARPWRNPDERRSRRRPAPANTECTSAQGICSFCGCDLDVFERFDWL